jgi:NAD(P)H-hydrate epimerase
MMENAGHGIADFVRANFKTRSPRKTRLVAVCGTGNNGGDVFVAARHLSGYPGYAVTVILLGRPGDLRTEDARINWEILKKMDSIETSFCNQLDVKVITKHKSSLTAYLEQVSGAIFMNRTRLQYS